MTGIVENIARLTGTLQWNIDNGPLHQFQQMLQRVQRQMQVVTKQADKLSASLSQKLSLNTNAAKAKTTRQVKQSLGREASLEAQALRQRKAVVALELQQSKLTYAHARQEALSQSQSLKAAQQSAVVAAKEFKAQQEATKLAGIQAKHMSDLASAKTRQARLDEVLRHAQERTVILQNRQLGQMTALERATVALEQLRQRGRMAETKFANAQADRQQRNQRQAERHQQANTRFSMQSERFDAWKARQNAPEAPQGVSLMAIGTRAAGIAAALYAIEKGVDSLSERIAARQSGASEAQQLNTALETAGGKRLENQSFARQAYIGIADKYGMSVSLENAKDYAKFVQGQMSLGKTLTQAIQVFADQSATFRAAALDKMAQQRASYQLNQIRAKGKPEGSDVNDLFDAIGGPVANSIRQAAATRLNFKGPIEKQAGWFKAQVTAGNILAKDFDAGMRNYLNANQDVLAKQMGSIDAAQTRADNQTFLNTVKINSDPALEEAVQENIKAHRELNEALQPLKQTAEGLDTVLTNLSAKFINFLVGKDDSPLERANKVDAFNPEKPAIDPSAFSGADTTGIRASKDDPVDLLARKLFGLPNYNEGPANEAMQQPKYHLVGDPQTFMPDVKFPEPPEINGEWNKLVRLPPSLTPDDLVARASRNKSGNSPSSQPAPVVTTTNNHNTTVQPANVNVTINAPSGVDTPGLAKLVRAEVRDELRQSYSSHELPQDTE